ncbi:MAG: endonuclease/exonuclease/phosphatase family protein [Kofleriaceae bacterium]
MRLVLLGLFATACRTTTHDVTPDAYTGPDAKVATFNVRRMFDTICDTKMCEPGSYEELPSPGDFDARATQIADAIRTLDADIIALQEIETQACLDALLARLGDTMPYGVLGETETAASVDVAVLSKTPLDLVVTHRADSPLRLPSGATTTFSRELLEVHVRIDAVPVVLFAAHFKSKSGDDPPRRLAEAQVSTSIVNEVAMREPDTLVILGGDLNDTPDSPPLDAMTKDGGLIRVADDLFVDEQATYVFGGRKQAIDHLLVAPNAAAWRRIPRSAQTWRGPQGGFGGSDHFALSSKFAVEP